LDEVIGLLLADEEISALRSKIKPEDRKSLLAEVPTTDVVLAYIISKARKEAKDKIFSDKRNGFVFDLLKHQIGLISGKPQTAEIAHNAVVAIAEEVDAKQAQTLAGLVRKENLAGKTQMSPQILSAFEALCEILSVDIESLK
jgi:hypothetical protein